MNSHIPAACSAVRMPRHSCSQLSTRKHLTYFVGLFSADETHMVAGFPILIDGIFGFSFKGDVRPPFDAMISVRSLCLLLGFLFVKHGRTSKSMPATEQDQSSSPSIFPLVILSRSFHDNERSQMNFQAGTSSEAISAASVSNLTCASR